MQGFLFFGSSADLKSLKRCFLLSKRIHRGRGGQKSVTFEHTYFMDDPMEQVVWSR